MSMEVMATRTEKGGIPVAHPTKKYRVEEGNWAWMGDIGVMQQCKARRRANFEQCVGKKN